MFCGVFFCKATNLEEVDVNSGLARYVYHPTIKWRRSQPLFAPLVTGYWVGVDPNYP